MFYLDIEVLQMFFFFFYKFQIQIFTSLFLLFFAKFANFIYLYRSYFNYYLIEYWLLISSNKMLLWLDCTSFRQFGQLMKSTLLSF